MEGMFSGISSKKCMFFVNQRYMKETRGPNVSKRVLSVFVCGAFIFQPILMDIFVMFLIKLSLYSTKVYANRFVMTLTISKI